MSRRTINSNGKKKRRRQFRNEIAENRGKQDHKILGQFDHGCVNPQYGEAHKVFMEARVFSLHLPKRTKFRGFRLIAVVESGRRR